MQKRSYILSLTSVFMLSTMFHITRSSVHGPLPQHSPSSGGYIKSVTVVLENLSWKCFGKYISSHLASGTIFNLNIFIFDVVMDKMTLDVKMLSMFMIFGDH
jgi:hypothetical protein